MSIRFNKKKTLKISIGLGILFIVGILFSIIYSTHRIEHIVVEGNSHYTEEEIKSFIFKEDYPKNSLYLSLKYKNNIIKDIPFIDRLEVLIQAPDTVKIKVYEKLLAGYVTYLGENVCFDKDGIVVECTEIVLEEIPHITGLHFSHIVLYDRLQVEEEGVFPKILELTKNLQKYQLKPSEIYFKNKQEIFLFFSEVRIQIGDTDFLDEKMGFIEEILPNLKEKKGEISLKNFKGEKCTITFQED